MELPREWGQMDGRQLKKKRQAEDSFVQLRGHSTVPMRYGREPDSDTAMNSSTRAAMEVNSSKHI